MTPPIVVPKKLIEVAIPLDDINKACGREKSIRHGHPATLHLWWARRPLAAARAVLFAQLVNDPTSKYSVEELRKPQVRSAVTRKRNELFRLLSELVLWESTSDNSVLSRARAEILASWKETCDANRKHPEAARLFDPNRLPSFHDPFAGGGAIPLEAQRLGLTTHATDLNPVAVLINKAMIEIPAKFSGRPAVGPVSARVKQSSAKATDDWSGSKGLAEDVRRYGQWLHDEAERRLGSLYPAVEITKAMAKKRPDLTAYVGKKLKPIAWLWARTVKSSNPAFAETDVPLVSTFMLAMKPGKEAYIKPVVKGKAFTFTVEVGKPEDVELASNGTKLARGANFECLMSKSPIPPEHIYSEANAGRMGAKLMAIVAEGERSRVYLAPTDEAEAVALQAKPGWRSTLEMPDNPRWFSPPLYGLKTYGDIFSLRQLAALNTFSDLVLEVRELAMRDALAAGMSADPKGLDAGGAGARAYSDALAVYLAFLVDKEAESLSTLATWSAAPKNELVVSTFRRQALPMTWDYAEANPFATSSGSLLKNVDAIARAIEIPLSGYATGAASQQDAAAGEPDAEPSIYSCDPPYYDNIGYADLSDFFYVWLRRTLKPVFPDLLATLATPKNEELVATPYRHGGKDEAEAFFLDGMTRAMSGLASRSHPAFPVTIYYAFKQSETESEGTGSTGWETFLAAVLKAGLAVVGTWPMRTERGARSTGIGTNALASSIILACRTRAGASTVARKDFLRELERVLPVAITEMTADPLAAIAPVDLAQACIGPGMAVFSQYQDVLEANGEPMSVHNALIHINKGIDDYFSHAEGDLDVDTRFCTAWFEQFGFEIGEFGDADVLARAKGTSVEGVKEAGVVAASKGKVRLIKIQELPAGWDPTKDSRVPVWEACHHMCRCLEDSEGEAGALLAKMPERQESIRLLAYRLYTLCERKGWAEHARPYNELIASWGGIVEASQRAGVVGTQMKLI